MNKTLFYTTLFFAINSYAQENVYPSPEQTGTAIIVNATVHVGNGQVLHGASVVMTGGKITAVGENIPAPPGANIINAQGKQVYPGLILTGSNLGLVEVSNVRATSDIREIGDLNPNIRTITAYNTDSKIINTIRSNGILMANIVPQGGLISGISSIVQLDAWNWEDAAYKTDAGIHVRMPSLMPAPVTTVNAGEAPQPKTDPVKLGLDQVDEIKTFLREAKAYNSLTTHEVTNLKLAAVKGLFDKTSKLFVHANTVKQMLVALDFVREFGVDMVIVGGNDSWQIADLLKQHAVPVILSKSHRLPSLEDEDVDQPYKTPYMLQKAGVLFSINDEDGPTWGRNLAFNAGTAVAYGLTKEQALQAITLNAARILGIADKTGSIEAGKDANIIISSGDILDMRSSVVTDAFIQGRRIDLNDKQKQLNERYRIKYGIKSPF